MIDIDLHPHDFTDRDKFPVWGALMVDKGKWPKPESPLNLGQHSTKANRRPTPGTSGSTGHR